ncbi:hypothetical protein NHX12_033675 [Muraenolepis orangiensis]|uniref:Uncharacterized protein n=1 Tax=Muraenolepis orangiensis TaxID=630683 RepID=A0A9Q0E263_9TELE|nr:hypothetical protein NHX12_033675 [Muraenolepis orangiensis]
MSIWGKMASMIGTWVFLQAVLLSDIHCSPVKKAAAVYQPEQADPGYDGTSFLSGPGDQKGSAVEGIYPPPGTSDGLPPASSPDAGPQALMPMGGSFGCFYPYDWRLLTGQYPPGTYTHVSSSLERGRDDWQENHYLGYDYPASPQEEQQFQTFPSTSDQSFQLPGLNSGPEDQEEPVYEEANKKWAPF